jgi:biopolymer transport protein ExbB/TolQ
MLAVALTIVISLGVCAMAAAVMVLTMLGGVGAWPVLAAGCIVLVTALAVLWLSETRRDRRLP